MARSSAGGGCICSLCLGGISLCSLSPPKSKHTYVRWCEGESSSQHLWWNDWMNLMNDPTRTPRCLDSSMETLSFHTRSEILARNKDVCFTDYCWIITASGRENPRKQSNRVGVKQCVFSVGGMERMVLVGPHFLLKGSSSHGLADFLWNRDWTANCRFVCVWGSKLYLSVHF